MVKPFMDIKTDGQASQYSFSKNRRACCDPSRDRFRYMFVRKDEDRASCVWQPGQWCTRIFRDISLAAINLLLRASSASQFPTTCFPSCEDDHRGRRVVSPRHSSYLQLHDFEGTHANSNSCPGSSDAVGHLLCDPQ
jgi:hypothetical protein